MVPHIRAIWEHLIEWLDYLHPMRHVGTTRMAKVPVAAVACALHGLMSLKTELFDLFQQTPLVYQLTFDLWVKIDRYCEYPRTLETDKRLQTLLMSIRPALLAPGVTRPEYGKPTCLDPLAQKMALSTTGNRPRKFYRRAIHLVATLERANPPNTLLSGQADTTIGSATNNQMSLLAIVIGTLLPTPRFARDVVLTMVDTFRRLMKRQRALECAELAAHVLWAMWRTAGDRRSLMWALKAKVFDLLVVLVHRDPENRSLRIVCDWLMVQGMYIRVLRALIPRGFTTVSTVPDISAWSQMRNLIMSMSFDKFCSAPKCRKQKPSVRRCVCLCTLYCSKECQQADWPRHRPRCKSIRAVNNDDALRKIGPEITTLDIRFQVLCSRSIVRDHAPAIVKWILERKDRNSYDFVVTIDCVALPPRPKYSLRKKGARVARIIVLAEVPGIAHDFYKTPHTLVACPGVPLRWPLDGYVPTDDGWMNPAGDWRSDAWAD
ncbi:hypothetical protein EV715DRAFT_250368 [Schizophyllum commune]